MDIPKDFIDRLRAQFPSHADAVIKAMNGAPVQGLNQNVRKPADGLPDSQAIAWNPFGRLLMSEHSFALDPLWHQGAYYAMEPASQSLAAALERIELPKDAHCLDLCAAPGGKTSVLLNALPDEALLVSNEIHPQRARVLYENAVKWGRANHMVTHASPAELSDSGAHFDVIVVDAPCSGEGMFRKDPGARSEWSAENVQMCAMRQHDVLDRAVEMLNPGGVLIYSTCTMATEENDGQVDRLLSMCDLEVVPLDFVGFGCLQTKHGWQFAPGLTQSEGLFLVALRRIGTRQQWTGHSTNGGEKLPVLPIELRLPEGHLAMAGYRLRYFPNHLESLTNQFRTARIQILKAGIALARQKGKHWLPDHELAMWDALAEACPMVPRIALSREEALQYLRLVSGRDQWPKSWVLPTYAGLALGWAKSIGNRWNNHYPDVWKLRQSGT